MHKEQVNNAEILKIFLHINKLLTQCMHMHTCTCAHQKELSMVGTQHTTCTDVTDVATMPESPEVMFIRFTEGLEELWTLYEDTLWFQPRFATVVPKTEQSFMPGCPSIRVCHCLESRY